MLPVTLGAIRRMGHGLPDKRSAANPIRQTVPLSGQAEPDRPLARAPSRNRPAPGASSNEGDRDSGARSKPRKAWPGRVREGGTLFLIRRSMRRTGDAVGGGLCPRRDRTQISEAPQAVESLHRCALRGADFCLVLRSAPELNELRSFSDWGLPEEALLA